MKAWPEHYRYVVIEGPIGVGKTSLARKLAERFSLSMLLEQPEENPFLSRFYSDGARYALPTQLFFLFQRIDQLRGLAQRDLFAAPVVSDFLFEKDPLFAGLTLTDEELDLYHRIYNTQRPLAPSPDLVIYLQAQPQTLKDRVIKRGNPIERDLSSDYLKALNAAYVEFFHRYDQAPLLIVNTSQLNPIANDQDFDLLLDQAINFRGPRAYFSQV